MFFFTNFFFRIIFRFPREDPTLAVWMDFAEKCSAKVKPRSVVCSAHFTEDFFNRFVWSVHLKRLAVPTIMIQRVKSVCKNHHVFLYLFKE